MKSLEIQKLSKNYEGVNVIDALTLNISSNEFVSIHGRSGCGKSSLLLMLGGLMKPSSGKVLYDGVDLYALSSEERAKFRSQHIGFVFQEFHLLPYLTVFDNVMAAAIGNDVDKTALIKRARELLDNFGLSDRANSFPPTLSVGERQRTALARALLNNPAILLADEPTGNLDSDNTETVMKLLSESLTEDRMLVLVTHDDQCAAYADKNYKITAGNI